MKEIASILLGETELKCRGIHPYASRLPQRFGGKLHDQTLQVVPFICEPTGRVWRKEDPPNISTTNGRLLYAVRCRCGWVTEYEVVRSSTGLITEAKNKRNQDGE